MRIPDDGDGVGRSEVDMRGRPAVFIGVVADMTRVHPQTLRHYERIGLIKPGRSQGNVRMYSHDDIERVRLIQRLTGELGVNLAGVEVILNMRDRYERLARDYKDREQELRKRSEAEIERLRSALRRLVG